MKSLLVDETSKENEFRRQTPNVIAKLMGLDGMPLQQSVYKQPKRSHDGFHRKTASAGSFRHRKACDSQSCGKIVSEQPLFKDVYEVRESSKGQTDCSTSQVPANRRHAEDEMAFTQQKFTDAKRLSADEKFHDSVESHEAIEVLNSNNHLLLKLLQEPDSLFAKHLHNLHASQQLRCGHVRNLTMPNMLNTNINVIGCQTGREASKKIDISMSQECQADLRRHVSRKQLKDSGKSATLPAKVNEIAPDVPTKIVLLKPNLGGPQKIAKSGSFSSSCELSDIDTHKSVGHREAELWGKKRLPVSLDVSVHKSQESEKLAKEITRQLRSKLGEVSFNMHVSGCRGYSADESSHEVSGNDSSYESDATIPTSCTPYHPGFHRNSSASRCAESSVNREGKKRLSERWKMTRWSEEIRVGSKSSTLREMLAFPDANMRLTNLDGEMIQGSCSSGFNGNDKLSGPAEPLGISSKDGWKDGCIGTLSRTKSLPTAYDHVGNPETCIKYACGTEKFLIPKEASRYGRKKGGNRESSWRKGLSSGVESLGDKKPYPSHRISKEMVNDLQGSQVGRNGKKNILEAKDPSLSNTVILDEPTCPLDSILNINSVAETEHENIPGNVHSGVDMVPGPEICTNLQARYDSSSGLQKITQDPSNTCHSSPCLQDPGAQLESPVSSKEADQPSPVSVLDAPFVEDLSSGSECFERVSAELHGLRMQLQLLKLETGAYGAGAILISGDEDTEDGSPGSSGEAKASTSAESWEASSYMADVLAEYEFDDNNPNVFMAMWHSSDCPLGPWVFEKLEKKYIYHVANPSRQDRRLLFDHINSGILAIAQRFTDPHPWVKSRLSTAMVPHWSKARFEAELHSLLAAQTKSEKDDMADNRMSILDSNGEWMQLEKYIDGIGCDMVKMMLDELVSETLTM